MGPMSARYSDGMGGTQFISISSVSPPRRWPKALLLSILLLPIAWNIFSRQWDYQSAYSGVIVEKGMACGIDCFLGRRRHADLYIVLQDENGKRFKKYVATTSHYYGQRVWNDLQAGSFVVKNKGSQEFPRQPGAKAPLPASTAAAISDWWLLLIIPLGALMFFRIRQLWKEL